MQCPKCLFDHEDQTDECLKCGLIFAKYTGSNALPGDPLPAEPAPDPEPVPLSDPVPEIDVLDAQLERWERLLAIPLALLIAGSLVASGLQPIVRIVLSMWVHECGHAVTAWLCGFGAFPGPWLTPISHERHAAVTFVLLCALGWVIFRAWKAQKWYLVTGCSVIVVVQIFCTLLPIRQAHALAIFGGDGGALVLGTLLMSSFYAPRESAIHRNGLRWGFLVIGAAGYMDSFRTWWLSRHDFSRIPFGQNVGVGDSDPSKLVDRYGWTTQSMVNRYVWLGLACLGVLVVVYIIGILKAPKVEQ